MFAEPPPGAAPVSFVHKRLIGAVGGFLSGGPAGAIAGFAGGGGGAPSQHRPAFTGLNPGMGLGFAPGGPCPRGHTRTASGACRRTVGAAVGDFFTPGTPFSDQPGEAVTGGFNMPAFVPSVVGNITRIDGSSGPILRCPRGTVLATDNLCYAKGTKGLAPNRKWKPGRRPFLPSQDLRALDRVAALKGNKVLKGRIRALGLC